MSAPGKVCQSSAPRAASTPWLYRIVRNVALNYIAAVRNRPHHILDGADAAPDIELPLTDIITPLGNLERDELSDHLQRALTELPLAQREALVLREAEGLSYEQIAEVMDIPVGTVRSRIHRARETLLAVVADWRNTGADHD